MQKSLDTKLAEIRSNPNSKAFIIADAKDADMARGAEALGLVQPSDPRVRPALSPEAYRAEEGKSRTIEQFQELIREITRQGLVDIMLMSASVNERLTIKERLFDESHITPAVRANDTTDIWVVRGGRFIQAPSRPFRSASIDHIQCGKVECAPHERVLGANLGLYSATFNNDLTLDYNTLCEFKQFREEAERKGFRYFLEVFDPNVDSGIAPEKIGGFVNDLIVRSLAGVTERGRPVFLKMVYHGPKFMEELVRYDSSVVVGILGGGAGTTYDAFKLIAEAQKYGARVALFGRKINNAEHQLAFIEMLRRIVEGSISPEEAVRAYHGTLQGLNLKPQRSLEEDLQLTETSMSYAGSTTVTVSKKPAAMGRHGSSPSVPTRREPVTSWPTKPDGNPDFASMTSPQRQAYHQARLNRRFGR